MESVPSEDLVRKLISLALSDSQLPVKMDRFDPSIGRTLCAYAMNNNAEIETLANLGFREHCYSEPLDDYQYHNHAAAADSRIREEAKDAILEHVFMPLVERSFWSGLQLDLQESPQSRDRRNHLLTQEAALVRLIDELNRFRDGQHSNGGGGGDGDGYAQAPAGDGVSPASAGPATPTGSSGRRRHTGRRRRPRDNPPQSPFGQSSSTFGGGSPFGGAAPAPSGFTAGGFKFGDGGPTFGASPFAATPPAPGSAPAFSFGGAVPPAPAPASATFSFGAPPPAAPFSFGPR